MSGLGKGWQRIVDLDTVGSGTKHLSLLLELVAALQSQETKP